MYSLYVLELDISFAAILHSVNRLSIDERQETDYGQTIGDWEMDTIVGKVASKYVEKRKINSSLIGKWTFLTLDWVVIKKTS